MTEPEQWQIILLKAAAIIEKEGWVKDAFHKNGSHCAVGAINKAAKLNGKRRSPQKAIVKLYDVVSKDRDLWPRRYYRYNRDCYYLDKRDDVMLWNDTVCTTGKEVVKAMRKAAGCPDVKT